MTSITSAVFRHFTLAIALAGAGFVFLSHSKFETDRAYVIEALGLPEPDFLLYLVAGVFLLACLGIAAHLGSVLTQPLQALIKQAETKKLAPGLPKDNKIAEVAHLYFILEAQARNVTEMEDQVDELESELRRYREPGEDDHLPAPTTATSQPPAERSEEIVALRAEIEALGHKNRELAQTLEAESRRPLSAEAAAQLKEAMAAAAFKSNWISKIASEIHTHSHQINRVAKRLKNTWLDTPISRIRDDVEEMARLSDVQLAALGNLTENSPAPAAPFTSSAAHKPFPLGSALLDLLETLSYPEIKLEPNIALPEDFELKADKKALTQALTSLIDTAAHRIVRGEVELRCRLESGAPAYRVSSVGEHRPDTPLKLDDAQRLAPALGCQVEVERKSESVVFLHLRPPG